MPLRALVLLLLAFILPAPATAQNAAGPPVGSFKLVLDPALQTTPYSGRVYIALGKDGRGEPRTQMGNWFSPIQILAIDVTNIAPGSPISVGPTALSFPKAFKDIPAGAYSAQAVARRSLESSTPGQGDGDLYSAPLSITFDPAAPAAADLKLDKPVTPRPFKETDRVKLVEIDSPLLSKFYGRPVKTRAGVILPKAYKDDPAQSYPTLYFIGGFGSDHRSAQGMARMLENGAPDNLLVVIPDPSSYLGHTVFADSANNGPRGQSLIQELIPAVESRFHGARSGERRFVSGISSGGWSSLWLQITYPDQFAGVWSHCPDPVDFRDFQRINLYAPGANMYRDQTGARRPLARGGSEDKPLLWYDDFVGQETVMGPGGQIHAFEGVFSPRGADGLPVPLFDRATGAVNPATAKAWEPYDIRLVVERNWPTLGPKLKGKIHLYAGAKDTFYLEGAAQLLKESLEKLGSDAQVVIVPDMAHAVHQPGIQAMFKAIAAAAPPTPPAPTSTPAPDK